MANWDWQVFCKDTIDGEVVANCWGSGKEITYLHWMIEAWGWTLAVSLVGLVIALVVGSLIGVMRTLPNSPWLVRFGNAWVELFRNIPLLVQMFLWFFVVPEFLPRDWSLWVKQEMPAKEFVTAALCLGLFTNAPLVCCDVLAHSDDHCPHAEADTDLDGEHQYRYQDVKDKAQDHELHVHGTPH
mgnify:CR=1 FL=1